MRSNSGSGKSNNNLRDPTIKDHQAEQARKHPREQAGGHDREGTAGTSE
jgi:hypothetical protein